MTTRDPSQALLGKRNFNIFWCSRTLDATGDAFAMIALPLLVLDATGSVAQMGLVTGSIGLGNLVSGLLFGSVVDRKDRRRLIVLCDLGRALIYIAIPLGWWMFGPSMALTYVVAISAAYLSTSVLITSTSAITNVVGQDELVKANGLVQAATALAFVAGPMLAGFGSRWLGSSRAMMLVSGLYLISAIQMCFVKLIRKAPVEEVGDSGLGMFLGGVRYAFGEPVIRSVLILLAAFAFLSEGVIDLAIFRLRHDMGQGDSTTGIVFGVASLGAILGGWLVSSLRAKWGFGICFIGGLMIQGVAIGAIGLAPTALLIAQLATAFTFANTVMRVNTMSLRQQITPDRLLGRVSSLFSIGYTFPGAIGAAVASAVAHKLGPGPVLMASGILIAAVGSTGTLSSARAKWPERTVLRKEFAVSD